MRRIVLLRIEKWNIFEFFNDYWSAYPNEIGKEYADY
jgi:hypothetical protein